MKTCSPIHETPHAQESIAMVYKRVTYTLVDWFKLITFQVTTGFL